MLKKYSEIYAPADEKKLSPKNKTINAILNYSKSLEVKKMKKEKILVCLN